jgi:hypothetical protein
VKNWIHRGVSNDSLDEALAAHYRNAVFASSVADEDQIQRELDDIATRAAVIKSSDPITPVSPDKPRRRFPYRVRVLIGALFLSISGSCALAGVLGSQLPDHSKAASSGGGLIANAVVVLVAEIALLTLVLRVLREQDSPALANCLKRVAVFLGLVESKEPAVSEEDEHAESRSNGDRPLANS